MKTNKVSPFRWLTVSAFLAIGALSYEVTVAQGIDDVESDMEAALSESEAAQSEARAAQNREREEQLTTEKAKGEALEAMEMARVRQTEATQQIRKIEVRITALGLERKKYEKMKTEADAKIVKINARVELKTKALAEAEAKHKAAFDEKKEREATVAKLTEDQHKLEADIIKTNKEYKENEKAIAELQKHEKDLEMKLEVLRKNAFIDAQKLERSKAKKDDLKRKTASIPTRVIVRTPKIKCDVLDAAGDGAKSIGKLKLGTKYEIYRVIDKRWVYLQYGASRAYAARTCF